MAYFDIHFIAQSLPNSPTPEWVLKQIVDPDCRSDGSTIFHITPTLRIQKPIQLLSNSDKTPISYSGGDLIVDTNGRWCAVSDGEICILESNEDTYFFDYNTGVEYLPSPALKIPINTIRLSHDELESFADQIRRQGINYIPECRQNISNSASEHAKALKKMQTAGVDKRIEAVCETIKKAAEHNLRDGNKERVIHHKRFIAEAGFDKTNGIERALEVVKKYITSRETGLEYHGYKYANIPVKSNAPYFMTEQEGLKI